MGAIGRSDLTKLGRRRLADLIKRGHVGIRGSEITLQRVISVANWLRDEGQIPFTACIPKKHWREDLRKDWSALTNSNRIPLPAQPRYTSEESRKLHIAAKKVDPRMALLLGLAAEYRLGQALRSLRTDLELTGTPDAPWGMFTIHGAGKKFGEVVYLTAGQRELVDEALSGYLSDLEADFNAGKIQDYVLFPKSRLIGRKTGVMHLGKNVDPRVSVTRDWIEKAFARVEIAAGIEHLPGRGPYGMRRINVDDALDHGISDRGLKASGGWKSTVIPTTIYAERENRAGRREAAEKRAQTRGEKTTLKTIQNDE